MTCAGEAVAGSLSLRVQQLVRCLHRPCCVVFQFDLMGECMFGAIRVLFLMWTCLSCPS